MVDNFYSYFSACDPKHYIWISYEGPSNARRHPEITSERFSIKIDLGFGGIPHPYLITYRLYLDKPEYHSSWLTRITPSMKDHIINCINNTYKEAIAKINKSVRREIINPDNPIPDYNVLETEEDEILDQFLDFYFNHLTITDFDSYFFDEENDCFMYFIRQGVTLLYVYNCSYDFHEVNGEQFYIKIRTYDRETDKRINYRISLNEPKYIYKSAKLPVDIRDSVIEAIFNTYSKGLQGFNEDIHKQVFDPNRPIPDYWKL